MLQVFQRASRPVFWNSFRFHGQMSVSNSIRKRLSGETRSHSTNTLKLTLNDGALVPWLGFGTGSALFQQDAAQSVRTALETGVTHLDGAQAYGNEDSLGSAIKLSGIGRDKLFVTTKLADPPAGVTVKSTLQESLKKLDLAYVDLFLIHSPFSAFREGKLKQWWKEMEEIKKEGLAKSIGVSNFKVEHLKVVLEDATVIPAVNQIELHPYVWDTASELYTFCKKQGITIASYGGLSPVARAPGGPVDPILASASERLSKASGSPVSYGQVLTKWLIQKGVIVITTSSKASRIAEALCTASLPDLTQEEISAIETEGSKSHRRFSLRQAFGE